MTQLIRPGDDSAHPTIRATYNDRTVPFRIDLQQRIEGDTYFVIRNTYDGLGRKFEIETGSSVDGTFSLYNTVLGTFNAYGKPLSQSTPFGPGETPFYATTTYDALGRPLTVTTPDGANAGYSYDGLTTSVTDANGHTTSTTMDVWGRTVSVTPPTGPGVSYQYDPLNRLTTAVRGAPLPSGEGQGGEVTVITYDNAGRKTAMSDPDMGNWSYTYDALGALVSQTDARGCTLGLSYDMLGRLTGKASSGDCGTQVNTSYGYDAGTYGKGRRTSMTDSSGSTSWSYDARGRVLSESKTIDAQNFVTGFSYNSADLPVNMTYPDGEVVTNTYTPQMMLQSVAGMDSYVSDTSYDSAGRITSRAFGNGTQTDYSYYAWDQQGGRLSTLTTSRLADQATLQNLAYSYDAIGNINTITDAVAGETQSFGYDVLDRLVSATASGGPAPYSETYTYDPLTGNLAAKAGVTYTYDADHPHAASSLSNGNSYEYDANGNQITRTVNGQTFVLAYDAEGRLVSVVSLNPQTPPPTATASPTNTASPTDTPTATETAALTETPTATEPATDTPAPTDTLTPIVTDTATESPVPTDAATPTETNTPDPAQTETAASTEDPTLTATSTATSMAADTPTITPTATNTPVPVPPAPAFQNAAFVYDGNGRMVKATINGVTTLYAGAHFEVTDPGAGQTVAKYYFAGASRIAMRKYVIPQSMALEYFLGDHLGSTSLTTDATGAKISEMRYTPWGELRYSWTDPNLNTTPAYELPDYTYTGQRSYTADFGLMFYNARWYDPSLGRFAQADSIVALDLQGLDRYAYVSNNPIKYSDPTGHLADDKIAKLVGFGSTGDSFQSWKKSHYDLYKILQGANVGDIFRFKIGDETFNWMIVEDNDGGLSFYDTDRSQHFALNQLEGELLGRNTSGAVILRDENADGTYTQSGDSYGDVDLNPYTLNPGWDQARDGTGAVIYYYQPTTQTWVWLGITGVGTVAGWFVAGPAGAWEGATMAQKVAAVLVVATTYAGSAYTIADSFERSSEAYYVPHLFPNPLHSNPFDNDPFK